MNRSKPPLPSIAGLWGLLWRAVVIAPLFVVALGVVFLAFVWTVTSLALAQWASAALGGAVLAPFFVARWLLRRRCAIAARLEQQRRASPGEWFV